MTSSNESSLIPPDAIPVGPPNSHLQFESLSALQGYIEGLQKLRKGPKLIRHHRLRQPISLPHVSAQRAIGEGRIPSRPPPRFHQSGDDDGSELFVGDLVLRRAVQRPPIGGIHVWIADVVALGDKKRTPLGSVVLRILQQSLMHFPDPCNAEDTPNGLRVLNLSPLEDLAQEYRMYEDMKELQGSVIPYCLGLHEIKMRNGEMACALILEHVEGEALDHWVDGHSNAPFPPVDQAWVDQASDDEVDQYEALLVAEQERIGPHSNNEVLEHPNVKWIQYLADAKELTPILFDALAALNKRGIFLDLSPEDVIITKEDDKPKSIVFMQFTYLEDSEKLSREAAWKKQVSLFLSYVIDCCDTHRPHLLAWGEQARSGFRQSLTWGDKSEVASTGT
ncbi:hypothetical protein BDZ89DRAFT_1161193 [Hymenopellis radicata]|nr:hypothetical protein BDZ89DRAFT_1161193 [Hymenopellis radicata]